MRENIKKKDFLSSVAVLSIAALNCAQVRADTFDESPIIETSGDGYIYVDVEENVVEPGIKAVTFTRTRTPDGTGFVDPYEKIITDFSDLSSRGQVTNCLMASNPDIYCDSASGSGKRVKARLTGRNPFDIRLRTTANENYPSVDYFSFGKASNFSGARMTGFSVDLLDADGNSMGELSPENAVLFNLDATDIGLGAGLPDGLFGSGGNEGEVGFFSEEKAKLALSTSTEALDFGALSNAEYVENFGTSFLDDTMVPDGLFWDDNDDPNDEGALVAWDNIAGGGWTYGTLDTDANIDIRLAELATSLGVEVSDLEYVPGGLVPESIVDASESSSLFAADPIEDLRNANLNYTITVGTVEGGEVTLRITPSFAPIVESATSEYQFKTAGYLDAAANVPYWDLGNSATYKAGIESMLGMSAANRANALESTGFSFVKAFGSLGFEFSRNQIATINDTISNLGSSDGGEVVAQQDSATTWEMGEDVYWLFDFQGSSASYDTSASSIGYDINFASLSVGAEKIVDANRSFGFLFGASQGTADAYASRGEIDSTGLSLTGFARSRFGDGGLAQIVLGYQDLSYDSKRYVLGETAKGKTDGSQVFAAINGEYMTRRGGLSFGPRASVEYYNLDVGAFNETGAGAWNQSVGKQSGELVLGSVGLRGDYDLPSTSNESILTGSLAYTVANGDDITVSSGFVGLPSVSYPIAGMDENWVDVQLGFESVLGGNGTSSTTLSGGYRGSIGSSYESHGLNLSLQMVF